MSQEFVLKFRGGVSLSDGGDTVHFYLPLAQVELLLGVPRILDGNTRQPNRRKKFVGAIIENVKVPRSFSTGHNGLNIDCDFKLKLNPDPNGESEVRVTIGATKTESGIPVPQGIRNGGSSSTAIVEALKSLDPADLKALEGQTIGVTLARNKSGEDSIRTAISLNNGRNNKTTTLANFRGDYNSIKIVMGALADSVAWVENENENAGLKGFDKKTDPKVVLQLLMTAAWEAPLDANAVPVDDLTSPSAVYSMGESLATKFHEKKEESKRLQGAIRNVLVLREVLCEIQKLFVENFHTIKNLPGVELRESRSWLIPGKTVQADIPIEYGLMMLGNIRGLLDDSGNFLMPPVKFLQLYGKKLVAQFVATYKVSFIKGSTISSATQYSKYKPAWRTGFDKARKLIREELAKRAKRHLKVV